VASMTKFSVRMVIVTCVVCLIAASCSTREEKLASFMAKGDQLLSSGDPVRAILEYKNALQIDPKNVKATFSLGRAYLAQKEYQKAFSTFNAALELDPAYDEARVQVASLMAAGNQSQMALEELARLKKPEAFQPEADLIKATALINLERYQEAIDLLTLNADRETSKSIQVLLAQASKGMGATQAMEKAAGRWRELDPRDPGSYLFIAHYAAEQKDKQRASSELEKMVEADPTNSSLPLIRAQSLEQLGFNQEAGEAFAKLPRTAEMQHAQADFRIRQGEFKQAEATLREILATSPDDIGAGTKLAHVLSKQNQSAAAVEVLDQLLKRDPKKSDRAGIILAKATIKASEGQYLEAKTLCETILGENQANMDAHMLLGRILLVTRDIQNAEIHLNQVAQARPNDEEAQLLLARCQLINKKDALSGDTLKRALEVDPRSGRLRLALVEYYFNRKDFDQALRVIDRGLELQPKDVPLLRTRGQIEASRKNYRKAEQNFRKIIQLQPEAPLGYLELGRLLLEESKPDDAIPLLKQALNLEGGWQEAVPPLAKAYLVRGDRAAMVDLVRSNLTRNSNSPLAHYYMGQAQLAVGNLGEAEKSFLEASRLAPFWPDSYRILADLYLKQQKLDGAIQDVEEQYSREPTPALASKLAVFYQKAGRFQDAIRMYGQVVDTAHQPVDFLNDLAYLYAEHATDPETLKKANEFMNRVLAEQPENPYFLDTAGWIAFKLGDLDLAMQYLQSALLRSPDNGLINLHAAVVLNSRGEKDAALGHLKKTRDQAADQELGEKASALLKEWQGRGT
jgi:tetratricopeptide (TPR) repeat protein